jgi:hypothetical protein
VRLNQFANNLIVVDIVIELAHINSDLALMGHLKSIAQESAMR